MWRPRGQQELSRGATSNCLVNLQEQSDFLPYRFRIHVPDSNAIIDAWPRGSGTQPGPGLGATLKAHGIENPDEVTLTLSAEPQAVFKVQAVTRMAARIPGHAESILCAQFSPKSSSRLATGSGDCTARIWDTETGTPKTTLKGHRSWVLVVSWSPDGERLATGGKDKEVRLWDPEKGKQVMSAWTGHRDFVTSLAWEPYHLWDPNSGGRLASSSKDGTVRVWRVNTGTTDHVLSGHKSKVTCVRWGGTGLIYTGSDDKTVKVWRANSGTLAHSLSSHSHFVNHLALSTEFVLRTGFFEKGGGNAPSNPEARRALAKARFERAATVQGKVAERLVSGSEDTTMFFWDLNQGTKPITRMHGHQKQVNHVAFSPDGSLVASAGWDNQTKIWSGRCVCYFPKLPPTSRIPGSAWRHETFCLWMRDRITINVVLHKYGDAHRVICCRRQLMALTQRDTSTYQGPGLFFLGGGPRIAFGDSSSQGPV